MGKLTHFSIVIVVVFCAPKILITLLFARPKFLIGFRIHHSCVYIYRYLFRSGNTEHPSDRFYNTTVEILPYSLPENSYIWSAYNSTTDGFLIVGSFNEFGIAEGIIEPKIGKVREIRLHVHTDSENWAILSEVSFDQNEYRVIRMEISCNVRFENVVFFSLVSLQIHLQDTTAQ